LSTRIRASSDYNAALEQEVHQTPGAHCYIVGDCLAVGLWSYVNSAHKAFTHKCSISAMVSQMSWQIIKRTKKANFDFVIISSGSNDGAWNPQLKKNLEATRAGFGTVKTFYWLVPINPKGKAAVESVAKEHGDKLIYFTPGGDRVHPASYDSVVAQIEKIAA